MRIGIDARPLISKHLAGIGTYLDNVLRYISSEDHENTYILYMWSEPETQRCYGENFQIKIVPKSKGFVWHVMELTKAVKRDHLDVFWGTMYELPRKLRGIRYVLTIHDLALLINPKWGGKIYALQLNLNVPRMARYANQILTISDSTKNDVVRICKVPAEKVHRVYLGGYDDQSRFVSPDGLVEVRKKHGIGERYFLFVGTVEPRKNIQSIVKAFNLVAQTDKTVELVIAGGMGWRYEGILAEIEASPARDRIKMLGYVDLEEKKTLYTGAIAFVFPSHYEGFGIPVLEAMSLGTLVITARNSSLPEVGGEAALYVEDENNFAMIAELMRFVMTMPEEARQNQIQLGKQQLSHFSWEECAKETARLLLGNDCGFVSAEERG